MTTPEEVARDPQVRAAVLAGITEAELRHLYATSILAMNVMADAVLAPFFAQDPVTLAEWEDVCGSRSGDLSVLPHERRKPFPRYLNEERKHERREGDRLYPRAICAGCVRRVPVRVLADDSLVYRSHGSCPARGRAVETHRVVGWGTFEHLAPAGWRDQPMRGIGL